MSQAQSFYEGHSFYEGLTWWFVRERIGLADPGLGMVEFTMENIQVFGEQYSLDQPRRQRGDEAETASNN